MGPDTRDAAIQSATEQLTALAGTRPRVIRQSGAVRIEVDVTAAVTEQWADLLEILNLGTAFGLTGTPCGRQVAWLSFDQPQAPSR